MAEKQPCNQVGNIAQFADRESVYDYRSVKLELSAACNARCQFCAMFKNAQKTHDFLTKENAEKFVQLNRKWFSTCGYSVEPFFNGESLLNPDFFEIIDCLLSAKIRLGDFDSNLGLKVDIERLAALPWRAITINIGGVTKAIHERVMGTSYELVISNAKRLAQSSRRHFLLYVKMNPVADNLSEQEKLSEFVHSIGTDVKWKSQQTGIPVPSDLNATQLEDIFATIYSERNDKYFRFMKNGYGKIVAKNSRCIYRIPCINANGTVTVCSHDQQRHLNCGNAFDTPLADILSSEQYKNFEYLGKKRELPFCEGCN